MIIGAMESNSNYSQIRLTSTGETEFKINSKAARLRLIDSLQTNSVTVAAPPSVSSSYTFTLPPNDGSNGQFLQTDGNGVTTWAQGPAFPQIGTWSIYNVSPATYTTQVIGSTPPVISLPTNSATGLFAIQKVNTGGGHGFQNISGSATIYNIHASVTVQGNSGADDNYYLQIFVDGTAIGTYSAATIGQGKLGALSITMAHEVPFNSVVTIGVTGSGSYNCNLLSPVLTMTKTQ